MNCLTLGRIADQPSQPGDGLFPVDQRRNEPMRTVTVMLILLNAVLGTMDRPTQHRYGPVYSCCRGTGPDAYCCRHCCWYDNCDSDLDCH